MRIANLNDRLVLVDADGLGAVDVETASEGAFSRDPQAVYERWHEFRSFAASLDLAAAERVPVDPDALGAPVPSPRQVVAIGLNYAAHAAESGLTLPDSPLAFTKFPSCIAGPRGVVALPPGGDTDWEVELVAVIGAYASHVPQERAWDHVAGLTVGQDISERKTQLAGRPPQFSLGKSFPGFGPTGPWLVTTDEFDDPDDLALECEINGETVQKSRTSDLVFSVPALVHRLSAVMPLWPGDVVFTGTPAGVGLGRTPPRYLADGDELTSRIEGIGELRQRFTAA